MHSSHVVSACTLRVCTLVTNWPVDQRAGVAIHVRGAATYGPSAWVPSARDQGAIRLLGRDKPAFLLWCRYRLLRSNEHGAHKRLPGARTRRVRALILHYGVDQRPGVPVFVNRAQTWRQDQVR